MLTLHNTTHVAPAAGTTFFKASQQQICCTYSRRNFRSEMPHTLLLGGWTIILEYFFTFLSLCLAI
jgi:hypothetical protein